MTKNDINKIRLIAGLTMIAIALIGFTVIVCKAGFDMTGMMTVILMGLIGWDIAFPEDYEEDDEEEYDE